MLVAFFLTTGAQMKRSTERILTTHAGALTRPNDLQEIFVAKNQGQPYDEKVYVKRVRTAVAEVVRKQIDAGIDIVNDGELGKPNFTLYARERLSGFGERPTKPEHMPSMIFGRDLKEFQEYFDKRGDTVRGRHSKQVFCNAPLKYI